MVERILADARRAYGLGSENEQLQRAGGNRVRQACNGQIDCLREGAEPAIQADWSLTAIGPESNSNGFLVIWTWAQSSHRDSVALASFAQYDGIELNNHISPSEL